MRITTFVLLALFLIIGCENPQDLSNEQTLYKGQVVQNIPAPFSLNGINLAKDSEGILILGKEVPVGTVYGSNDDPEVYVAEGGEILPKNTWVDGSSSDPVGVSLTSKITITFDGLRTVTVVDARDIIYVDANGAIVVFSGHGVITTSRISTGSGGFATLICPVHFSIGEEGGEWG